MSKKTTDLQSAVRIAREESCQATGVELLLAPYREVIMCRAEVSEGNAVDEVVVTVLKEFVMGCDVLSAGSQALALQLIDNQQGASLPEMTVSPCEGDMTSLVKSG